MQDDDGHASYGAEGYDAERTPLAKGKTTAVGKSPNTVLFSPLSMASSASGRQPGDDTMDSSFELDVVEEHTPLRASLKSISERDFNVPESVTAEEDAEHSWLRRRRDSDTETHDNAGNTVILSTIHPSAEEATIHRRVAELRLALRTADGALDKARARFEEAEWARNEAESEAAALRARVWTLEGAESLSGTRLHDGSLDLLRGELLNEATAELEEAARATAEAEERAREAAAALRRAEDTAAAIAAAASGEVETLSLEAAQARLRAKAEARDAANARSSRERAESVAAEAEAEAAKWRDIGKRETELRAAADKAAKIASDEAEEAKESAAVAAARESEAAQHNNWLQERVRELEDAEGSDAGARYGSELRRLREQLTADAAKAADELAAERAARRKLEALLLEARGDAPIPAVLAATETEVSEKVLMLEAKLNEEREYSARLQRELDTTVVSKPARSSLHDSQDSWADALGLQEGDAVSDGEKDEKVAMLAGAPFESGTPQSSPKKEKDEEKPASPAKNERVLQLEGMLEEAEREIEDLQGMNTELLEQRERSVAILSSATSTAAAGTAAAVEAALTRNTDMWTSKLREAERVADEATATAERAAQRVAMLQAECDAAQKDLVELRARGAELTEREAKLQATLKAMEDEKVSAQATKVELVESDKTREDQLIEARQIAAEAASKLADAERAAAEASEYAERAAAEADAKLAKAEEMVAEANGTAERVRSDAEAALAEAQQIAVDAKQSAALAVAEAKQSAADAVAEAHAKLTAFAEAEKEREQDEFETEKEWEEKLTEARHAAAEAQAKQAKAEAMAAEAKLAASRALIRAEEEREGDVAETEKEWEEKYAEAEQRAQLAESKLSMLEKAASESKDTAAQAVRRVEVLERAASESKDTAAQAMRRAEVLEKEHSAAQREINMMREREATAELAAEAEAAFAALEAGEEAKMEAAEALAQARAEAATARGELDALRESIRINSEREEASTQSMTAAMRSVGVTVVQMTSEDEVDTDFNAAVDTDIDDQRDTPLERALRRDREAGSGVVVKGRPMLDEAPSKTRKPVSTQRDRLAAAAAEAAAEVEALQDSNRNEFLPSMSERDTELDLSEPEIAVDHPTGEGQWVWHGHGTPPKSPTPREQNDLEGRTPVAAPVTASVVPVATAVDFGKPKTSTVARRLDVDHDATEVMAPRPARRLSEGGDFSRARSKGGRMSRVATHPGHSERMAGAMDISSSDEDDLCRISSDDESSAPSAPASMKSQRRHVHSRRDVGEPHMTPPRSAPTQSMMSPTRSRRNSPVEMSEEFEGSPIRASDAFVAVAATAHAAASVARGDWSADGTPKPSPAKLAAAALAASLSSPFKSPRQPARVENGTRRSIQEGEAALEAMRASRASLAARTGGSPPAKEVSTPAKRQTGSTRTSPMQAKSTPRGRTAAEASGRPAGTWGRPSPSSGSRPTTIGSQRTLNHRYA